MSWEKIGDKGRPKRPEPYQKLTFTLSASVCEEIDAMRKNSGMTRSEFVAMCVNWRFNCPETKECEKMREVLIKVRKAVDEV